MVPEVEAIPQMDALVTVGFVVRGQRRQDAKFDAGGVAVFLDRPYDLHGTFGSFLFIVGLDDLAKRSLAKQLEYFVCEE